MCTLDQSHAGQVKSKSDGTIHPSKDNSDLLFVFAAGGCGDLPHGLYRRWLRWLLWLPSEQDSRQHGLQHPGT